MLENCLMKFVSRSNLFRACFFVFLFATSASALSRDIQVVANLEKSSGKTIGNYRALIIGINDYQDDVIPDLKTAVNDATELSRVLKSSFGFRDVILLTDAQATTSNITQSLRDLVNQTKKDDSVLIYYAGHGELEKITGSGYWVPHNAKGGDVSTYMDNSIIQKYIKAIPARHVFLVSDSCFSGTLFGEARSLPPINNKFYASLYKEKSRWGMTSGNRTPVSDSGSGGHSIFAYHFLKELKESEKPYLTPRQIYQRIGPVVRNNSEQMPITKPIKNTGDEGGEFVFVRMTSLAPKHSTVPSVPANSVPPPPNAMILKGYLQINVNAANSQVAINGESKGVASPGRPLNLRSLPTGSMSVRVTAEGFESLEKKVIVKRNQWTQEVFELKRTKVVMLGRPEPIKTLSNGQCPPRMSFIPAGVFLVGKVASLKKMSVNAFCMDQYEVTQGEYERVIGTNPSEFKSGLFDKKTSGLLGIDSENPFMVLGKMTTDLLAGVNDKHPVESVTWYEAQAYCNKVGKRLPTEWEWEKAAKAGTNTKYNWGNELGNNNANCNKCGSSWDNTRTAPVGSFAANQFGLFDMAGNIEEWTNSDHDKGGKVLRGGSWGYDFYSIRSSYRHMKDPNARNSFSGFRCAQ